MSNTNKIRMKHRGIFLKLVPMCVTMLLGAIYMLNVSEALNILIGIVFIVTLLLMPAVDSLKYIMFIICANEMLDIGTTSLIMIFVALFSVKYCVVNIRKLRVNISLFFSVTFLLLFCTIVSIIGTTEPLITAIKHVFFLCYIAVVLNESKDNWQIVYTNAFRYIGAGTVYFCVLAVLFNGFPSLTERFTFSPEVTINFIGIICALAIVNLLYINVVLKKILPIDIVYIIGCAVCGLLTQSRSFILATAIGVVMIFLLTASIKSKIKLILGGVIFITTVSILVSNISFLSERIDIVLARFLTPSNDDISNGRYTLWYSAINSMINNKIYFWFGAGDYKNIGSEIDQGILAHNMFIETWVIFGIVGCVLVFMTFYFYIRNVLFKSKNFKFQVVSIVPLAVMLCALFYSHHFIGRSMSIVFIMSFLPILLNSNCKNRGEI